MVAVVVVVVVVVVATTPNYLRQASQNLGKYWEVGVIQTVSAYLLTYLLTYLIQTVLLVSF